MISKVLLGDAAYTDKAGVFHPLDKNPLTNIRNALSRLGVVAGSANAHQNHFHIYFKPPAPVKIGGGTAALRATQELSSSDAAPADSTAFKQWFENSIDNCIELPEDSSMLALDLSTPYAEPATVLVAQAPVAQATPPGQYNYNAQPSKAARSIKPDAILLACTPPGYGTFSPEIMAEHYFWKYNQQKLDGDTASVELLVSTKRAPLSYYQHPDGRKTGWTYQGTTRCLKASKPNPMV